MHRNQAGNNWVGTSLLFSSSSLLAGIIAGAALGALGSVIPVPARVAGASVLSVAAVVAGVLSLVGRTHVLQCNRETPQRWVRAGPVCWALRNGATLGVGATTRIGFWLWYAVPLGALFLAHPVWGALVYGIYAGTRGMAVWGILLVLAPRYGESYASWLLTHGSVARMATAGYLIVLGVVGVLVVGL